MTEDDIKFLREVAKRSEDRAMMQSIIMSAIGGLENSARMAHLRACDMEVVASMAMNTRLFKGNEHFLAQKLEHWKGQTSLRWDDQINKLKENHVKRTQ
jgi:hypothetical protein